MHVRKIRADALRFDLPGRMTNARVAQARRSIAPCGADGALRLGLFAAVAHAAPAARLSARALAEQPAASRSLALLDPRSRRRHEQRMRRIASHASRSASNAASAARPIGCPCAGGRRTVRMRSRIAIASASCAAVVPLPTRPHWRHQRAKSRGDASSSWRLSALPRLAGVLTKSSARLPPIDSKPLDSRILPASGAARHLSAHADPNTTWLSLLNRLDR